MDSQARILEWVVIPSPGDLPDPGIKPRSPASQADSLPSEPPGNLQCTYVKTKNWKYKWVNIYLFVLMNVKMKTDYHIFMHLYQVLINWKKH